MKYMETLLKGSEYHGNFVNGKKNGYGVFKWYFKIKINLGLMVILMMEIGLMTKFTVKENLFGQMYILNNNYQGR